MHNGKKKKSELSFHFYWLWYDEFSYFLLINIYIVVIGLGKKNFETLTHPKSILFIATKKYVKPHYYSIVFAQRLFMLSNTEDKDECIVGITSYQWFISALEHIAHKVAVSTFYRFPANETEVINMTNPLKDGKHSQFFLNNK